MRAVLRDRYGSPDVLSVGDVDRPVPSGDRVLVEVAASSLNTADLDHLWGRPRVARVGTGLGRPRTPAVGLDLAGRVVATGPEAKTLRAGYEVWPDLFSHGQGAFAEYVCAPEAAFSLKPATATFADAAAVPHSGVLALQALASRGPIRAGEEVLINGAGGCVGPFAVQIARAKGAVVTGVDHPDKLDFVRETGADRVVDYTRHDVTRDRGRYDLVVDIASTRPPLRFRRSLRSGGRYVLIARTLGGFAQAAILGGVASAAGSRRMGVFGWVPNRRADLDTLSGLIDDGTLRPLVDRRYSLEDTPAAYRHLAGGRARGKLVVLPADPTQGDTR